MMVPIGARSSSAAALALQLGIILHSHSRAQQTSDLSLIASSPFRMILQPTTSALGSEALQWIETSVPALLLAEQPPEQPYTDMEMVVQQVEFLEPQNATRLRFFVLATASGQEATSGTTASQSALNQHITETFASSEIPSFVRASGIPVLEDVQVVAVQEIVPSNPSTPSSPSSPKNLSTLDIVLIAVSGAIFIGIAYMVIQHIKDRGYIENQRLIALNSTPIATAPTIPTVGSRESGDAPGKDQEQGTGAESAPSTPSTVNSVTDVELNEIAEAPETPERHPRSYRLTAVATEMPSKNDEASDLGKVAAESIESADPVQFDKNFFVEERSKSTVKTVKEMNPAETASSDSSEDVFHIDVDALCGDDTRSKASSQSSAISEWMRTIRVVPTSSGKTGSGTQSTSESQDKSTREASSDPSVDRSIVDLSSLEYVSLNQSMESSTAGEKATEPGLVEV
jgi:hypothetical protein